MGMGKLPNSRYIRE